MDTDAAVGAPFSFPRFLLKYKWSDMAGNLLFMDTWHFAQFIRAEMGRYRALRRYGLDCEPWINRGAGQLSYQVRY